MPDFYDANIIEREALSWRLVAYPVIGIALVALVAFGIYSYHENALLEAEAQAQIAMSAAKTPEALNQVADQFPKTTQATLALLDAGNLSFTAKDYDAAAKSYQRIINSSDSDPQLADSARLGLASTDEAAGKPDDALTQYLTVAHRGTASPYAPFAYSAAAMIYHARNDRDHERETLTELAGLGGDSPFVHQAEMQLRAFDSAATAPVTGTNAAPAMETNATLAPAKS
jgi:predicted negative regulator of RcsB-dependent stress response